MKKNILLLLIGAFLFGELSAQLAPGFRDPFDENELDGSQEATDRNGFPELVFDSSAIYTWNDLGSYELWTSEFNKSIYNEEGLLTSNKSTRNSLDGGWQWQELTSYFYDQEKRLILNHFTSVREPDGFIDEEKKEYTYNGPGPDSYKVDEWDKTSSANEWEFRYRRLWELNDSSWNGITERFDTINGVYKVVGRTLFKLTFGKIWLEKHESKTDSGWVTTHVRETIYDKYRYLRLVTDSFRPHGLPLLPSNQLEYLYDAKGRNVVSNRYLLNTATRTLKLDYHLVHLYNSNDERVESIYYVPGADGKLVKSGRAVYTYGPGIYSYVPEERLYQDWDETTGEYLDYALYINRYSDLPDGRVRYERISSQKTQPGQGEWKRWNYYDVFFLKSKTEPPVNNPAENICTVPNPYPKAYHVQCDQLKPEDDFLLSIYDMNGRAVDTRHFKGCEGWSINKNLSSGIYYAFITQNGKRLASYKIFTTE